MKYRTINAFRGDTVGVPLLVPIPSGTVVRVHLRKTPESDTFYNLDITNNKIIIPEDISSACDGTWYFDVEFTKDLVVETVQRVTVYFDDDISRVYGTEATAPTSDFERRKIYAETFYKRIPEGEAIEIPLEGLDHFVTDAQAAATEAQGYAESAANYANTAGTAAIAAFEAQELAETAATSAGAFANAADASANSADQSAIAAESSASASQVSAESASDYSDNASTFASNAYGAAQDAVTAQQAAETAQSGAESAQSAAVTAKNAAQSAQSAAESAQSGAQSAKIAAETAQGLAEGARDAAVTAKNAAQTAQGLTETAKSGAETAQGAAETAAGTATTQAGLASGYKDTAVQAKDDAVTAKNAAEGFKNTSSTKASEAAASAALAAKKVWNIKVLSDAQTLTTGDGKMIFPIPQELNGFSLTAAHAAVTTVSSSGLPTFQIRNVTTGFDMLSTKISIDANENTSYTAVAAPVVNATYKAVATGNLIAIDCDIAGTGAKGLAIILTFENV